MQMDIDGHTLTIYPGRNGSERSAGNANQMQCCNKKCRFPATTMGETGQAKGSEMKNVWQLEKHVKRLNYLYAGCHSLNPIA